MSALISFLVSLVISAIVIWIVGRLNLGLSVKGFGDAIIAALVIALLFWAAVALLGALGVVAGGLIGAILNLVIAAIVLMISDRFLKGLKVSGFTGALVAALAIAVLTWLFSLLGLGTLF